MNPTHDNIPDPDRQFSSEEIESLWEKIREGKEVDPELEGALLALSLRDDTLESPPLSFAGSVMKKIEKVPAPGRLTSEQKLATVSFIMIVTGLASLLSILQVFLFRWLPKGWSAELSIQPVKSILVELIGCIKLVFIVILEIFRTVSSGIPASLTLAAVLGLALVMILHFPKPSPVRINRVS